VIVTLRARGPYSLADSVRGSAGGTLRRSGGVVELALRPAGAPALAQVAQRADGALEARVVEGEPEVVIAELRARLLLDADTGPFRERFRDDPLVGRIVLRRPGMRPLRRGTVAQALVAAAAGQLVSWREAALIERRVVARAAPAGGGLRMPPTRRELTALSAADLVACGLAPSRAGTLARVLRTLDPETLHAHDSAAVAARLGRERGLGPWSAGVVALLGLGRLDLGLVGDLGLVRLVSRLRGRPASPADTAALLSSYGEWQGLASLYLLVSPLASAGGAAGGVPARPAPARG
jgi:3-methyladenine DNA glycosylase/8-oxoguanine DNA glycosylase